MTTTDEATAARGVELAVALLVLALGLLAAALDAFGGGAASRRTREAGPAPSTHNHSPCNLDSDGAAHLKPQDSR